MNIVGCNNGYCDLVRSLHLGLGLEAEGLINTKVDGFESEHRVGKDKVEEYDQEGVLHHIIIMH